MHLLKDEQNNCVKTYNTEDKKDDTNHNIKSILCFITKNISGLNTN